MRAKSTATTKLALPDGFSNIGLNETLGSFKKFLKGRTVSIFYEDGVIDTVHANGKFEGHRFDQVVGYKVLEQYDDQTQSEVDPEEVFDHPLYPIFMNAIEQAIRGKGERHGGGKTPFMEQAWLSKAKTHGRGFLTGQASKKVDEAAETRQDEAFETEVLGAINYAAMSVIFERMQRDQGVK